MITLPKPLVDVKPGDPILSEAWNNVQTAIRAVYAELNKSFGILSATVKNKADGNPITNAIVTVIPTGDAGRPIRTGLYAGGEIKKFQVLQLLSGVYNLVVEAEGFASQTKPVTMDDAGSSLDLIIEMEELVFSMPSLFGMALNDAIKAVTGVTGAGFQVVRIIDSHGKDIPPGAIPDDAKTDAVLGQLPEPGTLIPKNSPVQIHTAAKAEFAERVKVPDLRGLTLEEAKAKLEAGNLVVGETSNISGKYRIIPR